MACYGGLKGILSGLTKSTDHRSMLYLADCLRDLILSDKELLPKRCMDPPALTARRREVSLAILSWSMHAWAVHSL